VLQVSVISYQVVCMQACQVRLVRPALLVYFARHWGILLFGVHEKLYLEKPHICLRAQGFCGWFCPGLETVFDSNQTK
jgi:hypothetical protein